MWQIFFDSMIFYGKIILQIFMIYLVVYYFLGFMRGTRGAQILAGIVIIISFFSITSILLELEVIGWIIKHLWTIIPLSMLVIFQPELRRAFAELGTHGKHATILLGTKKNRDTIDILTETAFILAKQKIGALIAVERFIGIRSTIETGTIINGNISVELLSTIFFPNTALHDGGAVVKNGKIVAAGCIFPLSQNENLNKNLGTRHRAAVGITEDSDSVAIVISEETGKVSAAYGGQLSFNMNEEELRTYLFKTLINSKIDVLPEKITKGAKEDEIII